MGDFSGDALREVSLPLVEKPVYNGPVTLSSSSRHRTDFNIIKVPSCVLPVCACRNTQSCYKKLALAETS